MVDPANGFPTASLFHPIQHAQAINSGKANPERLGVRALHDLALQVDLREPAPYFLQLVASNQFFPVPRPVIESAGSAWTTPAYMVNSGAFRLTKWRDGEIVLAKNSRYYNADSVRLRELLLVTISKLTTTINLYKAGSIDLVTPLLPDLFVRLLRRTPDFHTHAATSNRFFIINTKKPPFDNVLVRYALNMAIDKNEIERFMGAGGAALALLPPLDGYESPRTLPTTVQGRTFDVLAFDPRGARSLMSAAGFPEGRALNIEYLYPTQGTHQERFEILQKQLRTYLGVQLVPAPGAFGLESGDLQLWYRGLSAWSDMGLYPTYFLDQFLTGASANVTGWNDPLYDAAMAEAKSCAGPAARFRKLANCERMLLQAMPVIPLYFEAWRQLRKPYVRGIEGNSIDAIAFHRAWIDTDWRPL